MVRLGLGNSNYLEKVRKKWWPWLKRNYWWLVVRANLLTSRLKCLTSSAPLITHIITGGHLSRKCKNRWFWAFKQTKMNRKKKSPKWMKLKMETGHCSVDGNNKLFQHDDFWMSYNTEYFIVRGSILDNLDRLFFTKSKQKAQKPLGGTRHESCRVQLKIDFPPNIWCLLGWGHRWNSV